MPKQRIEGWIWDDDNLAELARHSIRRQTVLEVAGEAARFRRNRRRRAATYQMIGRDRGGALWTICIVQSSFDEGIWRAVTGWRATEAEATWYGSSR